MTNAPLFYAGIDGGGSHCRLRLEDSQGHCLATADSGPANVMRSAKISRESIDDALAKALAKLSEPPQLSDIVLCAGCAGANIPSAKAAFLRQRLPYHSVFLCGDVHAACVGAHNGENGAVLVCGTGSSATRYRAGQFTDFGGHGFPIGDKASGAWLGFEAIKGTLLAIDNLHPKGLLFDAVCEHFHSRAAHQIITQCAQFKASDYGALAPIVIHAYQQQDPSAIALINDAVAYLQQLITITLGDGDLPLCLIGGLTDFYRPLFTFAVQERITTAKLSPQQGAIVLAKQLSHTGSPL